MPSRLAGVSKTAWLFVIGALLYSVLTVAFYAAVVLAAGSSAAGLIALAVGLLVGLGALTATFLWLRPEFAKLSDLILTVGADGIAFRRRFAPPDFLPYGRLARAKFQGKTVLLELYDGTTRWFAADSSVEAGYYAQRIEAARQAYLPSSGRSFDRTMLDQRDRPVRLWAEQLGNLLRGDADYRQRFVGEEDLLAVLEDGTERPRRRVAAAVALASTQDPRWRIAIDDVAQGCASKPLRIALTRAGEGQLEAAAIEEAERLLQQEQTHPQV